MSKKSGSWKNRQGVVYSTDQQFEYNTSQQDEQPTLPPSQQHLRVKLDRSGRAGKQVTLVTGFVGTSQDLEVLTKLLKTKCGVGGSCKNGEVLIQGDVREKLVGILLKEGYQAKRSG